MGETTKPTAVLGMTCCSCNATFQQRVKGGGKWRQRFRLVAPGTEVRAYLCASCAGRFTSDDGVNDYLDADLERQRATLPASG